VRFIKKIDVQIEIFAFKHAHWTLLMNFNFNFKTACLHNSFFSGSFGPSLSAFAISKTVIMRNDPFLFASNPGDASCFRWRGLLAYIYVSKKYYD
jgi:hypothetical protein